MDNQLAIFEQKPIRRVMHNGETYFSIVDIIEVLTDSAKPRTYWAMLKKREIQLLTVCEQLKMAAADGKTYKTDAANTAGIFRILMSVPSPKAEPFKLWLAEVGQQAIVETENPEVGIERFAELYKAKGYSDEWKNRGVTEGSEYSILTATIAKETFGLTPSAHKDLKGLAQQNLRDHMTPLELIFTMLGEEITRSLAVSDDAQGFNENHDVAQQGGKLAGDARLRVEQDRRVKVVSNENYLKQIEDAKGDNGLNGGDSDEK